MKATITCALSIIITGCSLAPDYHRPATMADNTQLIKHTDSEQKYTFIDLFKADKELNQVLQHALINNTDIQKTAIQIKTAYAQSWSSVTDLIPAIDVRTNRTTSMSSTINPLNGNSVHNKSTNYQSSIGVDSYEVDIWGKKISEIQSNNDKRKGYESAAAAVRISLMADLAATWYETLSMIKSWHILKDKMAQLDTISQSLMIIDNQQRIDPLIMSKFIRGKTNDAISIASLEKEIVNRIYKIEYLSGYISPSLNSETWQTLSGDYIVPEIPQEITSDVIFRRPDVISAEMNIRATNGSIGAARAAFLPVVNIFARAYHISDTFDNIIGDLSKTWTITPSVILPVFSWPIAYTNLKLAETQQAMRIIEYRDTIAQAMMDIKDATNRLAINRQICSWSFNETGKHSDNFAKVMLRYQAGYMDLYSLYESLDLYSTSRLEQESNQQQLMNNTIVLLKALGG